MATDKQIFDATSICKLAADKSDGWRISRGVTFIWVECRFGDEILQISIPFSLANLILQNQANEGTSFNWSTRKP